MMSLLANRAVETFSPAQSESGIYKPLLPHPQEGWWSKTHSRSQTSELRLYKQIVSQICPAYWFFSLDLKDAYFHVQIAPHHRRFLRFAFEGVAYQYTVLPFGLSFAPHTFSVHECGSFPAETDGNSHPELPRGLAHFGPVRGRASISQISHTVLFSHLECLGLKGQFCQARCPQANKFHSWEQLLAQPEWEH